jgi:hypothetical protein
MPERKVTLSANAGLFRGLAKQNMLFHQAIGELVDNAIAARRDGQKFRIEINLTPLNGDGLQIDISDNGKGMNVETLSRALEPGQSATTTDRLNEHGFGLKNALATLSGGNGWWQLWTRQDGEGPFIGVQGPFEQTMVIEDPAQKPEGGTLSPDLSTLIRTRSSIRYMQSVQGRGAPATDVGRLREWLVERLGVMYRGFLEQDVNTGESDGAIVISIDRDRITVPPVNIPFAARKTEYLKSIKLGDKLYDLEYRHGTIDEVRRETLVRGKPAKAYYLGNQKTQGIDIRLGKRVIAMSLLDSIWKTTDGKSQLDRHNQYNDFVGELIIPDLPRGILTTVNSKTDFNLEDADWTVIFDRLNEFRPETRPRETSEAELKRKWIEMIKATSPNDTVTDERAVWPTGTYIDVYRRTAEEKVILYELKVGTGTPAHLYQLKMYWDGLVVSNKENPSEAMLMVESFTTSLEEMANMMNTLPTPVGSSPYNFSLVRLADVGLRR